jgi:YD repeat-containing protein
MKMKLYSSSWPRRHGARLLLSALPSLSALLVLLCAALAPPALGRDVGSFTIERSGTNIQIQWDDSGAALQSATNLLGPWSQISNAVSPYTVAPENVATFFRLKGAQDESLYGAPTFGTSIGNPLSSCGCTSPENPNSSAAPGNAQDNAMGNVYLQTGELVQHAVDLSIPGRGFDWRFERQYRSGMNYNGPLGQGWDFNYNRRLSVQPSGDVLRMDGSGRADAYLLLANGSYQSPSGFYTKLTRNSNGSFVERDRHGTQTFYSAPDSFGVARLEQITDRNNNSMTFFTNSMGQLTNVVDTLGRSIAYYYQSNGRLEQVIDYTGRTLTFTYDASGDLTSVTGPPVTGTPNTNNFPNGKTTLYSYNTTHQLLTATAPNEAAIGGPARLAAQYESAGGRLASLRLGGTNATGVAAGGTLDYGYTDLAQALPGDVTTAVFQTVVTNRNGNVTQYRFNQLGNVLNMVQFTRGVRAGDPPSYTTSFAYNADGETIARTNPALDSAQFTFDSTNPDRFQQGNLLQTLRLPGPRGGDQTSLVTSSTYQTNFNFVATATDARGDVASYTYDNSGNCIHITARIPSILEDFTYNAFGQMTSHTLPNNGSGARRLDTMIYYASGPQTGYLEYSIVDSTGFALTTTYDYDAVGNVIRTVDPRGHDSTNIFNSLNQTVRTLSRAVTLGSNTVRYQRDTFYDANNNVTNIAVQNIDDTGAIVASFPTITTSFTRDILDDRIRQSQTASATHTVTTTNTFDADQNRVLAASGEAVNGDQPNNVVQTLYDERDLVYRQIRAPNDPGHSTTQYDYDGDRNRTNATQGIEDTVGPRITFYSFDGYNRATNILDAMGNLTTTHYDPNGNAVARLVAGELVDVPGSALNVLLSQTAFSYDAMDRQTNADAAFFDTTSQTNIGSGDAVSQTVYSDNSQVLTNFDANNNPTATIYDTANRRSVVIDAKGNTKSYLYDANNNVTTTIEVDLSDSGQPAQTFTTTFSYDNLDRKVETVNNIGGSEFESYDSRNNRLSHITENGNLQRFGYDGLDRLLLTSDYLTYLTNNAMATNIILLQQTWDDTSRLTSQTDDNSNTTSYLYDTLNRMKATVYADGTSASNTYDVHDNRVSLTDQNGTLVTSSYDLLNRLGTNSVAPAAGVLGPVFEAYRYDGLSRVVLATNASSLVTRQFDSLSHLTQETQQVLPGGPAGTNTCSYDGVGNQLTCLYPGGSAIANTYDELNRKLTIADGALFLAFNQYIGQWRLEQRFLGNGINLNMEYDGLRRIAQMQYTNAAAGSNVDLRTFTYDGDGNKLTAISLTQNQSYQFDSLDRLIVSQTGLNAPATLFDLDGAGNRTQVIGETGSGLYTRNPGPDQKMNQYSITPFSTNTYDHKGNLTVAGTRQRSYDYRNQMVAFFDSATGKTEASKYDCFGRLVQQVSSNGTVSLYYNGNNVIQENSTTGDTNTYVLGGGIVFMTLGGQPYFPLCDDLNSACEATDLEGNVAESCEFSAFGAPSFFDSSGMALSNSAIGNPYLFRMERYDPETELGYTGTRYVDYAVGEFITRGGIWAIPGDLGNPRTFLDNDPVDIFKNYFDVLGGGCNRPPPGGLTQVPGGATTNTGGATAPASVVMVDTNHISGDKYGAGGWLFKSKCQQPKGEIELRTETGSSSGLFGGVSRAAAKADAISLAQADCAATTKCSGNCASSKCVVWMVQVGGTPYETGWIFTDYHYQIQYVCGCGCQGGW